MVIRIYELKNSAVFESADFVSLYEKDTTVLGADIVSRDEFVLKPGEIKTINKALAADTKFIAVFAAFRDLERAKLARGGRRAAEQEQPDHDRSRWQRGSGRGDVHVNRKALQRRGAWRRFR